MQGKHQIKIDIGSVKAIAFDLFDTLVYIKKPTKPYRELLEATPLTIQQRKDVKRLLLTTNTANVLAAFPVHLHRHLIPLTKDFYQKNQEEVNSTTLFRDSVTTLEALREKYSLFLISNLSTHYKGVVQNMNIERYFEDVFLSCELGIAKPQKEIFNLIKHPKEEILMVGNSYHSDYLGAKMAGLKAIWLRRDMNVSSTRVPVPSINSLTVLEKLLA